MEITARLRKRFCTDCGIPMNLSVEPYFTSRLMLYDELYNTLHKWESFMNMLQDFETEEDFYNMYNNLKDTVIEDIRSTSGFEAFINDTQLLNKVDNLIVKKDIFNKNNVNRRFIDIDIVKANFSSLNAYNPDIFGGLTDWRDYLGQYTNYEYLLNSKYLRQVIFGSCNPKRLASLEKYYMNELVSQLKGICENGTLAYSSPDEAIIDVTNLTDKQISSHLQSIAGKAKNVPVRFRIETFTLHELSGTSGYYKEITTETGDKKIEIKGIGSDYLPMVIRKFKGEEINELDKVFNYNGVLAKFMITPDIQIK